MIASHQIEITFQQRSQGLQIFFFAQGQIAEVKHGISGLDKAVPILHDQVLPTIRPAAIFSDIGVTEVGIRNQPGLVINGKFNRWDIHILNKQSSLKNCPEEVQ
jgi:hypothetical protein